VYLVSDAELVARLKANDDEAYREVVARFGDPLYGYIYSITGDHHLSEDVLSDTYLRMIKKIDSYTFYGAPFKAWLYRIAHNLAIDAVRRTQRLVGSAALESTAASVGDPAITVAAQLDADEVLTALAELTDEQQQVVLLRFVAQHSTAARRHNRQYHGRGSADYNHQQRFRDHRQRYQLCAAAESCADFGRASPHWRADCVCRRMERGRPDHYHHYCRDRSSADCDQSSPPSNNDDDDDDDDDD
jgi:RNA polymerase sigma-70 factor, ECF subfamily